MGRYLDIANRVELEQPLAIPQVVPDFLRFVPVPDFDAGRARRAKARDAALAGLIPAGWSAQHWLERLEYLADLSKSLNPDVSAQRQREADAVRRAMGGATA